MSEKLNSTENKQEQSPNLESHENSRENQERMHRDAEAAPSSEGQVEDARNQLEKHAVSSEDFQINQGEQPTVELPRDRSSKQSLYSQTLQGLQRSMSPAHRRFSKVIHNKAVEGTSEALEKSIMRPSIVLGASLTGFIGTLAMYLVAKRNGFELSGFEFIGFAAIGAVIGILSEGIIRQLRKRSKPKN